MPDEPCATAAAWLAWTPLPRRWLWWPICTLRRHRVIGGYCRCRAIVSFKIVRGLDA